MTGRQDGGLRIAMIGPLPPPLGGTTVSFQALCRFISPRVGTCFIIDTARRGEPSFLTAARTIASLLMKLPRTDVVTMHFSDRAAIGLGPIIWALSRVAGKPCVFRQFGGSFDRTVASLPKWYKAILSCTIFRSDALFLQTKSMMNAFRSQSDNLYWFPTARSKSEVRYAGRFARAETKVLKCLFLSQVSKDKGVLSAVDAVNQSDDVQLDIYGPPVDVTVEELVSPKVRYCGTLSTPQINNAMASYDVLIFPTVYPGEGYSGTLVEASMVGLPIVATRWQSLPEMFTEDEVLFIDHGDPADLPRMLRGILARPTLLMERSEKLILRANDFSDDTIFTRFLEVCLALARKV